MRRAAGTLLVTSALAACGLVPRSDYSEGAMMTRFYPVEYNKLAGCTYDSMNRGHAGITKVDFPDRKAVRLTTTIYGLHRWEINFQADGPARTRVEIPIPPIRGDMQPEPLLAQIEACLPQG